MNWERRAAFTAIQSRSMVMATDRCLTMQANFGIEPPPREWHSTLSQGKKMRRMPSGYGSNDSFGCAVERTRFVRNFHSVTVPVMLVTCAATNCQRPFIFTYVEVARN